MSQKPRGVLWGVTKGCGCILDSGSTSGCRTVRRCRGISLCTWDLGGISMLWEDSLSLKVPLRLYWESAFVGGFSGMLWSHSGIRGALKEYESIWGSVKDPGAGGVLMPMSVGMVCGCGRFQQHSEPSLPDSGAGSPLGAMGGI